MASDAFQQGYDAYWAGAALSDSPYPQASRESSLWYDGWHKAQEEDCEREEKD